MKQQRLFSPIFVVVLLINALISIVSYMINPILPGYLVAKGVPFADTGLISSIMSWVALFFIPFSGVASDRFNKKFVMLVSYIATAICMVFYVFASNVTSIIIVRIIHGIAFAFSSTLSITFSTTFVSKSNIAEGLAYVTLTMLVGNMFGPQIGSSVAEIYGVSSAFIIAALLSILSVLIICFLPYKETKKRVQKRLQLEELFSKKVAIYMVLISLFSFGNSIILYYLVDFGNARGIENITIFYTVNTIVMLFARPIFSKLHDRKGIAYILYPAYVITAISMFLLAKAYTLLPIIGASALKAIGQGCGSPAIQAESIKALGTEKSGVAVSTCMIGQNLGNCIGPVLVANLVATSGYELVFNLAAWTSIAGIVIFYVYQVIGKSKKVAKIG